MKPAPPWMRRAASMYERLRGYPAKPVRAFVLGGGGGKGACQIGMLRALAEAGIRPDLVVGVSIGALNGTVFATDPTLEAVETLESVWREIGESAVIPNQRVSSAWRYVRRSGAAFPAKPVLEFIRSKLAIDDLSETAIPMHVLLTDAHTGAERWFSSGPAVEILYGSSALPGVYPPVSIGGDLFVDGGVVDDAPARRAHELGATEIYLLLCGTLYADLTEYRRPVETLIRSFYLTKLSQIRTALASIPDTVAVKVIECPAASRIDTMDFSHAAELIDDGYESARLLVAAEERGSRQLSAWAPAAVAVPEGVPAGIARTHGWRRRHPAATATPRQ